MTGIDWKAVFDMLLTAGIVSFMMWLGERMRMRTR